MPRPLTRPLRRMSARLRTHRGLRGAAVATVAAALLTAGSQAPESVGAARAPQDDAGNP